MDLLTDVELERSAVVANCRMNRERNLTGTNGYDRELGFDPLEFLTTRCAGDGSVAWLDLCCGTGTALVEAARIIRSDGSRIKLVGVDLAGRFHPAASELACLRLVEASLSHWQPDRPFDLVTCVHGLHYVGDKLRVIARSASWLVGDGLFVANLDSGNIKLTDDRSGRKLLASLRRAGLGLDRRRRRVLCRGRKRIELPVRYLGADDRAGPNYTGQPAVDSYYELVC